RSRRAFRALEKAFREGCNRFGFRVTHFSVQGNHVHLMVEAEDKHSLARGMQGLAIRMAKALNRLMERKGKAFSDRYHAHVLRTQREVRNALAYVLGNFARHAAEWGRKVTEGAVDAFSSAAEE